MSTPKFKVGNIVVLDPWPPLDGRSFSGDPNLKCGIVGHVLKLYANTGKDKHNWPQLVLVQFPDQVGVIDPRIFRPDELRLATEEEKIGYCLDELQES